ncbi:MAG TPA: FHA domain-containing protein [Segeticoccus sp.]|jgi:hypothetical protein|nr:FHA domain-containing protein [Segeticoccus sp.]
MSELTITVIRLGLLILLWAFILSVVGVLRGDLYGTRVITRTAKRSNAKQPPGARSRQNAPTPAERRREQRPAPRGPQHLTVVEGSMRGTSVPLRDNLLIGRNPECSLSLGDDFASGRHARLYRRDDAWFVDDLGSTNGTFVGNQRVEEGARVDTGSRIRIGQTVLELRK